MWFVIVAEDKPNSLPDRIAARPAHLARLHELQASDRLLVAGPCPAVDSEDPGERGFTGSVIIAEFNSLKEAQGWADKDPYLAAGVYQQVTVKPFKRVLP